jgi:hypothetical protein
LKVEVKKWKKRMLHEFTELRVNERWSRKEVAADGEEVVRVKRALGL